MVLMNLFAGQQWRHRRENRFVDTGGEGEGEKVALKHVHYHR